MNSEKMGQFIAELRKSHQLTQRDLAAKLNVTDKSVSKWERGLSCPDISLLTPLSNILGITINELLNGGRSNAEVANIEISVVTALQYADKTVKSKAKFIQTISAAVFAGLLILSIMICAIIDFAISGAFTWSLIVICGCLLAGKVIIPIIVMPNMQGITLSLAIFSVLIVPFFLILSILVDGDGLLFSISVRVSVIVIAFLWIAFALFKILRSRQFLATAVVLLLSIPCSLAINFALSRVISTALFDVWDAMTFAIIVVLAGIFLFLDFSARKRNVS